MPNDNAIRQRHAQLATTFPAIDAVFRAIAARAHLPGVAYGVVADGELIHSGGFGVARVGTPHSANVGTAFRIASMTKSFTALAIVMLRDAGLLALDDPAAAFVPELADLVYLTRDAAPITVRQLLSMAAGWPEDNAWGDRQMVLRDDEFSNLLRAGTVFANVPGVAYEYSNYGYMVLGRIISKVAGVPCLDFITQRILRPLGMMETGWNDTDVPVDRCALGYRWQDDTWEEEPPLRAGGEVAAFAGLTCSVQELARWVAFFLSAWPPRDEADTGLVRRSSLREMQKTWQVCEPEMVEPSFWAPAGVRFSGYGYGLFTRHNGHTQIVTHSGGLPGFGSNMCWAPAYGVGVVALANLTYAPMNEAGIEALAILLQQSGVRPRASEPAPALVNARLDVIQLMAGWDDALADRIFAANFFLDEERARWQARLQALRARVGELQPEGAFDVENRLRGAWTMAGARGSCRVWISLAPAIPPLIQEMTID